MMPVKLVCSWRHGPLYLNKPINLILSNVVSPPNIVNGAVSKLRSGRPIIYSSQYLCAVLHSFLMQTSLPPPPTEPLRPPSGSRVRPQQHTLPTSSAPLPVPVVSVHSGISGSIYDRVQVKPLNVSQTFANAAEFTVDQQKLMSARAPAASKTKQPVLRPQSMLKPVVETSKDNFYYDGEHIEVLKTLFDDFDAGMLHQRLLPASVLNSNRWRWIPDACRDKNCNRSFRYVLSGAYLPVLNSLVLCPTVRCSESGCAPLETFVQHVIDTAGEPGVDFETVGAQRKVLAALLCQVLHSACRTAGLV